MQQISVEEKVDDEPIRRNSQANDTLTTSTTTTTATTATTATAVSTTVEETKTSLDCTDAFQETKESPNVPDPSFPVEFEDNFDFKNDKEPETEKPTEQVQDKPKFTEKELKVLRLQLENAEYLKLKSLLQAKINSEQFEIVKLRSHVALKNKQESNVQYNKENKENYSTDEQELRQRLIKENAMLEQKRLSLVNLIFQERVACIQLKIELAMKEILKS